MEHLPAKKKYRITIIPSPELIASYSSEPATAVVIDVLRASTTMVTAMEHGAKAIYPLESLEEAQAYAAQGKLVGAERNVAKCPFAQFGNDPSEYTKEAINGQEIYFTTTNGTRTIEACMRYGHEVIIGTFVNLEAVVQRCQNRDVLAVCAGWNGQISSEDSLFAAALAGHLSQTHDTSSDFTKMMLLVWNAVKGRLQNFLEDSEHYQRLRANHLEHSLEKCLQTSIYESVPTAYMTSDKRTCLLPQ